MFLKMLLTKYIIHGITYSKGKKLPRRLKRRKSIMKNLIAPACADSFRKIKIILKKKQLMWP